MDPEKLLAIAMRISESARHATDAINNAKAQRMADFETLGISEVSLTPVTAELRCHTVAIDSLIVLNAQVGEAILDLLHTLATPLEEPF